MIRSIFFICVLSFPLYNCKSNTGTQTGATISLNNQSTKTDTTPVETLPRNTSIDPAFEGQTRVRGIKTITQLSATVLTDQLSNPWGIKVLPDGRLLVSEKNSGTFKLVSADGQTIKTVTGLPTVENGGQGGLLGIALDPDFGQNKMVYWAYSLAEGVGNLTAVGKGKISADESKIENPTTIFKALPAINSKLHFGSRLVFDSNGFLFVSVGERSILEGRKQAQWLNSGLGKVFKITKDGKPAPNNPFLNTPNAMPGLYSYGHRNPQGLAFHPITGELWLNEFGPKGGDELNLVLPGKNYGWPTITYGEEYTGITIGKGIGQAAGMEQPVYFWDPSISPSGMTFYKSNAVPEWQNDLFIGCLSGQHICRLVIKNNKVVGEERLLAGENERFRDIVEGLNGELFAITDSGKLYKISKK